MRPTRDVLEFQIEDLAAERDRYKADAEFEKRRREAAEEVIKYMSESGMSIVPWNEVYKSWQSIKKEAAHE